MKSKESQVAAQVRLKQWALDVKDCMNRPENMTVEQWCEQHGIKKANYYRRLRLVRQACLEQTKISTDNFVELPVPESHMVPLTQVSSSTNNISSTVAVIHTASGISIEISENATADFIKNLIGALTYA